MNAQTETKPITLHQALRAQGYGNRPHSDKGREVFCLSDGASIGVFHAHEAWLLLAKKAGE